MTPEQIAATLSEANARDICECGDWREDHRGGTGACKFNGPGDLCHGFTDCHTFRLSVRAILEKSDG